MNIDELVKSTDNPLRLYETAQLMIEEVSQLDDYLVSGKTNKLLNHFEKKFSRAVSFMSCVNDKMLLESCKGVFIFHEQGGLKYCYTEDMLSSWKIIDGTESYVLYKSKDGNIGHLNLENGVFQKFEPEQGFVKVYCQSDYWILKLRYINQLYCYSSKGDCLWSYIFLESIRRKYAVEPIKVVGITKKEIILYVENTAIYKISYDGKVINRISPKGYKNLDTYIRRKLRELMAGRIGELSDYCDENGIKVMGGTREIDNFDFAYDGDNTYDVSIVKESDNKVIILTWQIFRGIITAWNEQFDIIWTRNMKNINKRQYSLVRSVKQIDNYIIINTSYEVIALNFEGEIIFNIEESGYFDSLKIPGTLVMLFDYLYLYKYDIKSKDLVQGKKRSSRTVLKLNLYNNRLVFYDGQLWIKDNDIWDGIALDDAIQSSISLEPVGTAYDKLFAIPNSGSLEVFDLKIDFKNCRIYKLIEYPHNENRDTCIIDKKLLKRFEKKLIKKLDIDPEIFEQFYAEFQIYDFSLNLLKSITFLPVDGNSIYHEKDNVTILTYDFIKERYYKNTYNYEGVLLYSVIEENPDIFHAQTDLGVGRIDSKKYQSSFLRERIGKPYYGKGIHDCYLKIFSIERSDKKSYEIISATIIKELNLPSAIYDVYEDTEKKELLLIQGQKQQIILCYTHEINEKWSFQAQHGIQAVVSCPTGYILSCEDQCIFINNCGEFQWNIAYPRDSKNYITWLANKDIFLWECLFGTNIQVKSFTSMGRIINSQIFKASDDKGKKLQIIGNNNYFFVQKEVYKIDGLHPDLTLQNILKKLTLTLIAIKNRKNTIGW